jgi:hypothetical protein
MDPFYSTSDMFIDFNSLPGASRIWVYQANRKLTAAENSVTEKYLMRLCEAWETHGTPLRSSFTIAYQQFIVLGVDEQHQGASGCSIDGSVHALNELQQHLHLDFFDRTQIAFLQGDTVALHSMRDLKSLFENKTLSGDALSFNNTVTTKEMWDRQWIVPVKDTWLARYLPKPVVAS